MEPSVSRHGIGVPEWLGRKPPKGRKRNRIQPLSGKSFNALLRLHGPLEPGFDKSWKPDDFELVK